MNKKFYLPVAIVATAGIIACGSSGPSESDTDRLNDQANGATTSKAPKKVTTITDGDWEVGTKDNFAANILTPGTYVVTSPEDSIMGCTWTTLKNFSGEAGAIISLGTVKGGKSGRFVVKKSYGGVSLLGDCLAKKKE